MSEESEKQRVTLTTARTGWVWLILVVLVGLFSAWDCARRGYGGLTVTVLAFTAAVGWLVALIFVLPRLTVEQDGVRCRNVLVSVFIPWRKLADAKRTLFVELVPVGGAAVKVWAAPVSAFRRVRGNSRERAARAQSGQYGSDDAGEGGQRELSAALIEERDSRLAGTRGKGMNGDVVHTRLGRDWGIFAALAALALLSLLLV